MAKKRQRIEEPKAKKNNYFTSAKDNLEFVSSGCQMIDNILGGGYPLGRMVNIIGDKSTAKTALATEACINFDRTYGGGLIKYRDVEAAFDEEYAAEMGMPIENIDFGKKDEDGDTIPLITIEDLSDDLSEALKAVGKDRGIYVLDSFDALSDEAEMERSIRDNTYTMNKQKQASVMFRKLVREVEASKLLLLIISQVRDNIGVAFGEKHKRSGGKALDFYASQALWLAHIGQVKKTMKGIDRAVGIEVRAKVKKNKVGIPFRECDFTFLFGFGIDDVTTNVEWLLKVNRINEIEMSKEEAKKFLKQLDDMDPEKYQEERVAIAEVVRRVWAETEEGFLPKRRKY